MMANRSIQNLGEPAKGSGATVSKDKHVDLNGTQGTEPIKASGQMIPRKQAGHMTATDHVIKTKNCLQTTGRPHMTRQSRATDDCVCGSGFPISRE